MKRVKIMLLSLALFAVVGGALAFKAKFISPYCTTLPVAGACPAGLACPNTTIITTTLQNQVGNFYCYTTVQSGVAAKCGNNCLLQSTKFTID